MKTAMTELIELLELNTTNEPLPHLIDVIKEVYIEKEKEQIQKAFSDGQETPINHPTLPHYSRDEYYNDNYNN